MLLGGAWHGAGWTFILWGGLHGLALIVNRIWSRIGIKLPAAFAWALTFVFVIHCWVIFRADSLATAGVMFRKMWAVDGLALPEYWLQSLGPFIYVAGRFSGTAGSRGGNTASIRVAYRYRSVGRGESIAKLVSDLGFGVVFSPIF